jgi:acyl-phosphate glycerol 3-phosphate acyltransferase
MISALRPVASLLIGYALGSIPFGYVIVRLLRGIDIRDYGSHNIGATNVLRVVGPLPALVTLLGDVVKGVAPVLIAAQPVFSGPTPQPWILVGTAVAAIAGHAYSAFFYLKERRFARGKAIATGLGALVGLLIERQIPALALLIPAAIWLLTVGGPRLVTARWGFVSLASILAASAVPLVLSLSRAPAPYLVFAVAVAVFVLWKHKENLGRLLDGVEPRFGERLPIVGLDTDDIPCAFMIHPITAEDWWQTRRFSWARLPARQGILPMPLLKQMVKLVRPMKVDAVRGIELSDGRRVTVYLIGVPLLPEQIKGSPRLAVRRAVQAAQLAKELGARVLGLGAFWSVVGNKGEDVQKQAPVDFYVTNGGAYTAGTVRMAVPMVLRKLEQRGVEAHRARAAVIGANGVVGFGICRELAQQVAAIVMIGTDLERLEKSAVLIRRRSSAEILTTTALESCRDCDLIFSATSQPEPVLFDSHVREGTLIYDLGRPADVDESARRVPGVEVIPGGVVRPPGNAVGRLDVHFGEGLIPACMAETIIIAVDSAGERVSLGDRTRSENIDYFVSRGAELGFRMVEEDPLLTPSPSPVGASPVPQPASR